MAYQYSQPFNAMVHDLSSLVIHLLLTLLPDIWASTVVQDREQLARAGQRQ